MQGNATHLDKCLTIGGDVIGEQCIFPFAYEGVTYHGCPYDEERETFWCATRVTQDGVQEYGQWGKCSEDCTKGKGSTIFYIIIFNVNKIRILK